MTRSIGIVCVNTPDLNNTQIPVSTRQSHRNAAHASTARALPLFEDPGLNLNALLALGAAGTGASEVGEVLGAVDTINTAGSGYQTYTDTFRFWADRLTRLADGAGAEGREDTLRRLSLRAAQYYARALSFVLGTDKPGDEESLYRSGRSAWDTFAALCEPVAVQASVPWGRARMPLWFFRPDTSAQPRPTIILTNGGDGQNVDMWTYGIPAALERGWNALVYDGPGQGQLLFINEIPFHSRWEDVVTPLVDWLHRRPEVDPARIALTGFGMAGNLAPRAAAFEHRLAALVAMPGCVSPWRSLPADIRSIVSSDKGETNQIWNTDVVPGLSDTERFTYMKRFEAFSPAALRAARAGELFTDFWTPARNIIDLDITEVAPRITVPTLVLDYEEERCYPGQAEDLYRLLRAPKDYVKLSALDGARLHCSPMAPQVHCEVAFDWLEDVLSAGTR